MDPQINDNSANRDKSRADQPRQPKKVLSKEQNRQRNYENKVNSPKQTSRSENQHVINIYNGPPASTQPPKAPKIEAGLEPSDLLPHSVPVERKVLFEPLIRIMNVICPAYISFIFVKIASKITRTILDRNDAHPFSPIIKCITDFISPSWKLMLCALIVQVMTAWFRAAKTVTLEYRPELDMGPEDCVKRHELNRLTDQTSKGFSVYEYQPHFEFHIVGSLSSILRQFNIPTCRRFRAPPSMYNFFPRYTEEIIHNGVGTIELKDEIVNHDLLQSVTLPGILSPLDTEASCLTKLRHLIPSSGRVNLVDNELETSSVTGTATLITYCMKNLNTRSTLNLDFQNSAGSAAASTVTGLQSSPTVINCPYQPVQSSTWSSKAITTYVCVLSIENLCSNYFHHMSQGFPVLIQILQTASAQYSENASGPMLAFLSSSTACIEYSVQYSTSIANLISWTRFFLKCSSIVMAYLI